MKKQEDGDFIGGLVVGIMIGVGITLIIMVSILSLVGNHWRSDAIKNKAAHYDSITGDFTWNSKELK